MDYFEEFKQVNVQYLKAASPSGWLLGLIVALRSLLHRMRAEGDISNPEIRKQMVRVELRVMPEVSSLQATRVGPIINDHVQHA